MIRANNYEKLSRFVKDMAKYCQSFFSWHGVYRTIPGIKFLVRSICLAVNYGCAESSGLQWSCQNCYTLSAYNNRLRVVYWVDYSIHISRTTALTNTQLYNINWQWCPTFTKIRIRRESSRGWVWLATAMVSLPIKTNSTASIMWLNGHLVVGMCTVDFKILVRLSKKTWIRFGMSLARCEKTRFGSDITVIYYLCNSWEVNLQQILQHYCYVEWSVPNFVWVVS